MKHFLASALIFALLVTSLGLTQGSAAAPILSTEDEQPITLPVSNVGLFSDSQGENNFYDESDVAPQADSGVLPFVDVSSTSWYYEDVVYVYENGIMKGTSATEFLPSKNLTRGEAVTVLHRIAGEPPVSGALAFEDVSTTAYYYKAVLWAASNGIVKGTSPTQFCPGDDITREQMAAILHRYYIDYLGREAGTLDDLSGFADKSAVHSYAITSLSWAVGSGIIKGVSHNNAMELQPRGNTTRAQMAALLRRLCILIQESGNDSEKPTEPDPTDPTPPDEDDNPYGLSSDDIVDFIKLREGFNSEPYWDYGQWTVGYGICCRDDEGNRCTKYSDYEKIADKYFNLTEETAEILLMEELASDYEVSVTKFEKKYDLDFDQNEFDSLVSFTFNLGSAWTSQSYKLSRCLAGTEEYSDGYTDLELMDAMGSWCRVGGSVAPGTCKRRIIEASIFLYDDYATDADNANFCYARYKGNGSYLTVGSNGSGYDDAVDYYIRGLAYGELLTPVWTPIAGTASLGNSIIPSSSEKTFVGWFTNDGTKITADSIAEKNQVLTAKWG